MQKFEIFFELIRIVHLFWLCVCVCFFFEYEKSGQQNTQISCWFIFQNDFFICVENKQQQKKTQFFASKFSSTRKINEEEEESYLF